MISKMTIKGVTHDIKDDGARELIESLQENVDGLTVPTKMSELENDSEYVKSTENTCFTQGIRVYNNTTQGDGRKVDILTEHIQGVGYGGYEDDLHINYRSSNDVRILENGTGTLYYKNKEVADREYVDEQISNIGTPEEYELPIATSNTLGGIKVGANLTIDEDGTLNAIGGGGEITGEITGEVMPIGTMIPFGSQNNIPANWRICDGSEVSRTAYADLFNVIGTAYGEGDGETTFNLPNKKGRVSVGYDIEQTQFNSVGLKGGEKKVALTIDEMPKHTHTFVRSRLYFAEEAGPNALGATSNASNSATATTDNAGSGIAHNNLQPYEVDVWIIKVSNVVGNIEKVDGTIIDNLSSTSSTDGLSANMGRELNNKIENSLKEVKQVYSTEEKVVGVWIDNSPIYRKVVEFGYLTNASSKFVEHNIKNIDKIISVSGYGVRTDGWYFNLPFISSIAMANCIQLNATTTQIEIRPGSDRSTVYAYVILEYTKQ